MDAEQASMSTIIIDQHGNPVGQVIYRCALCRKICDSSSDAMAHYHTDHVEMTKLHMQQQPATPTISNTNRGSRTAPSSNHHPTQISPSQNQVHNNRQFLNSASSSAANSLLKRAAGSSAAGSLLRRTGANPSAATSASNSLLKRASNVIRSSVYQSGSTRSVGRRPNATNLTSNRSLDTVHRQYATTSASRAAKRYSAETSNKRTSIGSNESNKSQNETNDSLSIVRSKLNGEAFTTRARATASRQMAKANQYTANLKAKLNAQSQATPSTSSAAFSSPPGSDSQKSTSISSSNSTPLSTQTTSATSSSASETSISAMQVSESTPSGSAQKKDKAYSLRPRGASRRSVRIS